MNIIEIQKLNKEYTPGVKAVNNISLDIECGKIYGLLGSNGAGKTTLIRMLIGSIKPTNGDIKINQLNPFKDKIELRKIIGYMPQKGSIYEDLTPVQNLDFFGQAHEIENLKERIDELLNFFDLYKQKDQVASKFSGGMKRKLSLACALIHKPQILFLDEPTAAIDPALKESIWQMFDDLKKQGTTIFVSSHAMEEAVKCDKLCVLQKGSVIYNDTPANLFKNSKLKISFTKNNKTNTLETKSGKELTKTLRSLGLNDDIEDIKIEVESLESIIIDFINKQ